MSKREDLIFATIKNKIEVIDQFFSVTMEKLGMEWPLATERKLKYYYHEKSWVYQAAICFLLSIFFVFNFNGYYIDGTYTLYSFPFPVFWFCGWFAVAGARILWLCFHLLTDKKKVDLP